MKNTFTFLLSSILLCCYLTPTQAQSKLVSIKWTAGQSAPERIYAEPSHATANARAAAANCPTSLGLGPASQTVCAGSTLKYGEASLGNQCGINTNAPTTIELSDASGNFSSPTILATATGEISAASRLIGSGVRLPTNLPAGTGYLVRLNNQTQRHIIILWWFIPF